MYLMFLINKYLFKSKTTVSRVPAVNAVIHTWHWLHVRQHHSTSPLNGQLFGNLNDISPTALGQSQHTEDQRVKISSNTVAHYTWQCYQTKKNFSNVHFPKIFDRNSADKVRKKVNSSALSKIVIKKPLVCFVRLRQFVKTNSVLILRTCIMQENHQIQRNNHKQTRRLSWWPNKKTKPNNECPSWTRLRLFVRFWRH